MAVAAGAFGAHALAGRLGERERELWESATRYLTWSALGGLAMALHLVRSSLGAAGLGGAIAVLAGGAWFSLTLYGLALGGPRWLGALTPLGGLAMILGFLAFALAMLRAGPG
ncbi:MAG: DUF423 domain-containing protein [Thermoanaerobaculia bacterium]|nr:MAG: DUF423 domain-containing protein [Thermoanaerobaculia bacterium]